MFSDFFMSHSVQEVSVFHSPHIVSKDRVRSHLEHIRLQIIMHTRKAHDQSN